MTSVGASDTKTAEYVRLNFPCRCMDAAAIIRVANKHQSWEEFMRLSVASGCASHTLAQSCSECDLKDVNTNATWDVARRSPASVIRVAGGPEDQIVCGDHVAVRRRMGVTRKSSTKVRPVDVVAHLCRLVVACLWLLGSTAFAAFPSTATFTSSYGMTGSTAAAACTAAGTWLSGRSTT